MIADPSRLLAYLSDGRVLLIVQRLGFTDCQTDRLQDISCMSVSTWFSRRLW